MSHLSHLSYPFFYSKEKKRMSSTTAPLTAPWTSPICGIMWDSEAAWATGADRE